MKSLKIIQVLSKILKVVSTITFVVSIVVASISLLGVIILPITKDVVIYDGKTFSILIAENGVNYITALTALIISLVTCLAMIFTSKYNEIFFRKELELGTPFDKTIVKSMRKMAIINIALSIGLNIVLAIVVGSIDLLNEELNYSFDGYNGTVAFGIAMLVISLFCDYGAETSKNTTEENNN